MKEKEIFTLGHSTRTTKEFLDILKFFRIEVLVDIRHYPGSKYCPQYNKESIEKYLPENGLEYIHIFDLGGRRKMNKDSDLNSGWRSTQFRGYADYMQTDNFSEGLKRLMNIAREKRTVIMCSEAVPWRCHRSMVADALMINGFRVVDLYGTNKFQYHSMTPFAVVKGRGVIYPSKKGVEHEL